MTNDEKLDKILEMQHTQSTDLTQIKTILLPPGEDPPLVDLKKRVSALERWRSYLAGAFAVIAALFGWHVGKS